MLQDIVDFLMKFGPWGLFVHSMIDAIIFPIPALFLQVPLSLVNPSDAFLLATVGYIGCLIGTPIGYFIGKFLGNSILYKILKKEWVESATTMFQKNGDTAVLIGSFTPIPFKVFTILSGALNFPLWRLMLYAALGRAAKFYLVGGLIYFYGQAAEKMVHNASMYLFAIAVPLIVLFLFFRRRLRKKKAAKTAAAEAAAASAAEETAQEQSAASVTAEESSSDTPIRATTPASHT
ncbi:membrane protein DedA, SNARE-associated domain [Paenibacillus catalpae]|uniref:Membrane protein DedA, SNARE-associated domain n=1 Tax=Paenibacillus catalpae TaxID=1045775 RepID=A0A1I2HEV7_9BACL|nr:VTT domain-containing protein [Paenibacillus catalpae]SFF28068.1 membrane protein DedA, SNARE-associated domain [Paenibacillus catalpae]